MKNLILIFLFLPIVSIAQNEKVDSQFVPFIGKWKSSTKEYEIKAAITHEPSFSLHELGGLSTGETEVLFFEFYYFEKTTKKEIKIEASLENPRAFTAFPSYDQKPDVLVSYENNAFRYKLEAISEKEILLTLLDNSRHGLRVITKKQRNIPKEPSPIPKEILLKRLKD